MGDEERRYGVRYKMDLGAYTAAELREGQFGGCDQILVCSYVEGSDGSGSYMWISSGGKERRVEMDADRQFKCWMMLAKELADDERLGPGRRKFCGEIFELVRQIVLETRETSTPAGGERWKN